MLQDHASCYRAIAARDRRFDGYIFTGVKTTGIYCRPICPARLPQSENVIFYPSAAAAQEAGFRPCLRCRPETAPDTPAWRGTSATIGRALRLIDAGALDENSVAHLAMRLGLGERQLRRLFIKHVGASPVGVALTRRINLAKQLIHETNLPMAQIALGSGFGSIRRFNEVFQRLFARPPSAIRRSLAPEQEVRGNDEMILKLRFRAPYDWNGVAGFLRARLYQGVEVFDGRDYCRSFCVEGVIGTVRVGPGGEDWLRIGLRCADLSILSRVIARLRSVFDLDCDPNVIAQHLGSNVLLAPIVADHRGLRLMSSWDGFEGVVRAVLGQQVTVAGAIGLGNQVVTKLGLALPQDLAAASGLKLLFPTADAIANADLTFLKMPNRRQETLRTVAQTFLEEPDLMDKGQDYVRQRLGAISGIGQWTLDYIALRVLRDPDALPVGDVALKRAFAALHDGDLGQSGQDWRPWRSYATQYLWQSLV
jgi:AraC family transcriptional regulator, regulatory protein of adaptative response / DNA-3-methyladenine glycosylase II